MVTTTFRHSYLVLLLLIGVLGAESGGEQLTKRHRILILDFGSQYSQLIARNVREMGVYCELHPCTMRQEDIRAFAPAGIILSGGPASVTEHASPRAPASVFAMNCPVLGICYGMQAMAVQHAGVVAACAKREFGHAQLNIVQPSPLFAGFEPAHMPLEVWMSHGDQVTALPEGFSIVASSSNTPIACMEHARNRWYGVQFHPEVTHTTQGKQLLENFVVGICGCSKTWHANSIIDDMVHQIRTQVGSQEVLLALSGGVDSTVLASVLHRAIGDRLHCVLVDHGLLRAGEVAQVVAACERLGIHIQCVDAKARFMRALAGKTDPEEKRKIIGHEFIQVFEEEAKKFPGVTWFAQGTIYSDVIESGHAGTGTSQTIKSHHNVGGLPATLKLKLIEPLRNIFKDEVRRVGLALGLPASVVFRHPFPGPGLGVRILGEIKPEYVDILTQVDAIFMDELRAHNLYDRVSQAFAVFLPVKSVAVKGDARAYEYVVALRAVETDDFMTARWAHLPHDFLAHVAARILNEVQHVARVTYDISHKPPATIEWE